MICNVRGVFFKRSPKASLGWNQNTTATAHASHAPVSTAPAVLADAESSVPGAGVLNRALSWQDSTSTKGRRAAKKLS